MEPFMPGLALSRNTPPRGKLWGVLLVTITAALLFAGCGGRSATDSKPAKAKATANDAATDKKPKITRKHLTIYTDVPAAPAIEELPQVFDLAVPQWLEYFELDEKTAADWMV